MPLPDLANTSVVLQDQAPFLLVLHAIVAIVLGGASTHLVIVCIRILRGDRGLSRLVRIYSQVIAYAFVITFGLGLLLYPTFRYHTRALFLDRHAPWAANLFDMKENFVAFVLPLALGLGFVGAKLDFEKDGRSLPYVFLAAFSVWVMVTFAIIAGLLVTNTRGV
jgi:hypothetical protein